MICEVSGPVGIFAHAHRLDIDAGQGDALFEDLHRHFERHVLRDNHRAERRDTLAYLHQLFDAGDITASRQRRRRWDVDQSREAVVNLEIGLTAGQSRRNNRHVEGRDVDCQGFIVAVEDHTARRGHRQFIEPVFISR